MDLTIYEGRAQTAGFLFDCRRLLQIPAAAVIGLLLLRPEGFPLLIRCRADAARPQINVFPLCRFSKLVPSAQSTRQGFEAHAGSCLAYTVPCILCRIQNTSPQFFSPCRVRRIYSAYDTWPFILDRSGTHDIDAV